MLEVAVAGEEVTVQLLLLPACDNDGAGEVMQARRLLQVELRACST